MPEPWTETRLAAPGAGEAEHAAHLAVAARVLEERLRDPLRPQRVAGEQDEGCDVARRGSDVGAHWPQTSAGANVSRVEYQHVRMAAGAHDRIGRAPSRRGLARGAVGRPGHPGAGRLRHPGPARGRRDRLGRRPRRRPTGLRVLLGEQDGRTWFAVITGPEAAQADRGRVVPAARPAAAPGRRRDSPSAPLVFHALGLAEWLWVDPLLPALRRPLEARAAGHELACADCGTSQFPRTDPAVIMVVTAGEPGQRGRALPARPPGDLAGGPLLDAGRASASRGRRSRTPYAARSPRRPASSSGDVEYFGNQPWPLPASLMLGFVGRAESDGHQRRRRRDRGRALVHPRGDEGRAPRPGALVLPGGVSISRSLVEHWYGGPLPGQW